jgi:AraC-like DNA-binding protein
MLHYELLRGLCLARDWLRDCDDPPSVSAVAQKAGLSPFHFIRLFKAVFGETPHQYRSNAQIERAKTLLILSDRNVTEVCMAVGFSSLGSFSSLFTRRVGVSPTAWRRRHRPAAGRPREIPAELIPGCFSLMGHIGAHDGNFEEAHRDRSG